jgi:hypothetical protein
MSKLALLLIWGPVLGIMAAVLGNLILLSLVLGHLRQWIA